MLAERSGFPVRTQDWVLEGGAIDGDGTGLVVTTEQCLLNVNRNPALDREAIEQRLGEQLGLSRVLWLGDGLLNDLGMCVSALAELEPAYAAAVRRG